MNNAELHAASALAQLPNLIQEQTKVLRDIATALAHIAIATQSPGYLDGPDRGRMFKILEAGDEK